MVGLLFSLSVSQLVDRRLQTIDYDPGRITSIAGCPGYETAIQFNDDERVENIGLGDADAWTVVGNQRGNRIFAKPKQTSGATNMVVMTSKRTYGFALASAAEADCRAGNIPYVIQFRYPGPAASMIGPASTARDQLPPADQRNSAYTYLGEANLVPLRIFDDGKVTYFVWADGAPVPAIYASDSSGVESIVNLAHRGDYLVVDQVVPAFVLRRGTQKTTLFNDAYRPPSLDAASPRPRGEGKRQ